MISDSPVLDESASGKLMASDDKKIKTNSAPENEAPTGEEEQLDNYPDGKTE